MSPSQPSASPARKGFDIVTTSNSLSDHSREAAEAGAPLPPGGDIRMLDSRELFAGRAEVCIEHEGALYRLKITRQGKLILNK